jgi:8-oxo-dGTP pyrophosphatase MutT (NUDIX family)
VFPGGKLDAIDQRVQIGGELSDPVMSRLRKSTRKDVTDRKLRGLALAAIRETFEETGLVVGHPSSQSVKTAHPVWRQYLGRGVEPPLAQMDFIARAITPPYRTRRFDTRFFLIHDEFIHNDPEQITDASGELNELHWLTLNEARNLDLPAVTRWAIDLVEERIQLEPKEQLRQPAPFMRFVKGKAVSVDL